MSQTFANMKSLKYLIALIILFYRFDAKAENGCLVLTENRVYTSKLDASLVSSVLALLLGTNPIYSAAPYVPLSNNCASWSPTSTPKNCRVCPNNNYSFINVLGVNLISGCNIPYTLGNEGTFTMVQCNLDDYTFPLIAATGIFGLLVIRKRNKK